MKAEHEAKLAAHKKNLQSEQESRCEPACIAVLVLTVHVCV